MNYLTSNFPENNSFFTLVFQPYKEGAHNLTCLFSKAIKTEERSSFGNKIGHFFACVGLWFPVVNIIVFVVLRHFALADRLVDLPKIEDEPENIEPSKKKVKNDLPKSNPPLNLNPKSNFSLEKQQQNLETEKVLFPQVDAFVQKVNTLVLKGTVSEKNAQRDALLEEANKLRAALINLKKSYPEDSNDDRNRVYNKRKELDAALLDKVTIQFLSDPVRKHLKLSQYIVEYLRFQKEGKDKKAFEKHLQQPDVIEDFQKCYPKLKPLDFAQLVYSHSAEDGTIAEGIANGKRAKFNFSKFKDAYPKLNLKVPAEFVEVHSSQAPALSQFEGKNDLCGYYALFALLQSVSGKPFLDREQFHNCFLEWGRLIYKKRAFSWLCNYEGVLKKEIGKGGHIQIEGLSNEELSFLILNSKFFKDFRKCNNLFLLERADFGVATQLNYGKKLKIDDELLQSFKPIVSLTAKESENLIWDPKKSPAHFIVKSTAGGKGHYIFFSVKQNEKGVFVFKLANSTPSNLLGHIFKEKYYQSDWFSLEFLAEICNLLSNMIPAKTQTT